jgi:hypothetical protein
MNFVRDRIVDSLIGTIKNILYKILFISRCNSSSLIGTILIYIYIFFNYYNLNLKNILNQTH